MPAPITALMATATRSHLRMPRSSPSSDVLVDSACILRFVSEPRAVATGSSDQLKALLDPVTTAQGSDTTLDTTSVATGSSDQLELIRVAQRVFTCSVATGCYHATRTES